MTLPGSAAVGGGGRRCGRCGAAPHDLRVMTGGGTTRSAWRWRHGWRVPAGFFGVFMSVNPVFAALTGLVVLGQSLGLAGWLAIAAIVNANVVSLGTAGRRAAPAGA
jgi:hypothetical protein